MVWHKSCYSSFTSKAHISRLSKSAQTSVKAASTEDAAGPSSRPPSRSSRSSTGEAFKWEACIFCHNTDAKDNLSSVVLTTFKMSDHILKASKYDQRLSVHLAGVSDLIASEGKYHVSCFVKFTRQSSKAKEQCTKVDLAMQWLVQELKKAAQRSHVLELSEVWERYCKLVDIAHVQIPPSFLSRRASFKEKLAPQVEDVYDFINRKKKHTLLVPLKFEHSAMYNLVTDDHEDTSPINVYNPSEDGFLEMVHLALKLRSDILTHPAYKGFEINEEKMISCVPESLFMFLRMMFGGQALLEEGQQYEMQDKESKTQAKILSIAQDLVYNISGGKHWTPKHLGLASTLHQATRSKELVQIFHNAGHIISYENVLQVDTALAEKTLESVDPATGAVTPTNFTQGRFVHFTCDNININDTSFDGKNSFHATQVAAWQSVGPESDMGLQTINPSTRTILQVPQVIQEIVPAAIQEGKAEPKSTVHAKKKWFSDNQDHPSALSAEASS